MQACCSLIGRWCCAEELGFIDLHGARWNGWFVQPHSPALSTILLLRRLFISAAAFVMTLINYTKQKLCSSCILTRTSGWCDISPRGSGQEENHTRGLMSIYRSLWIETAWWLFRFNILQYSILEYFKCLDLWFMIHKAFIDSQHNRTPISLLKNHTCNVNWSLIVYFI